MAKKPLSLSELKTSAKKHAKRKASKSPASKPDVAVLRQYSVYMKPETKAALDVLKAETGIKGPDLLSEAVNLLFRQYGKPQVG